MKICTQKESLDEDMYTKRKLHKKKVQMKICTQKESLDEDMYTKRKFR